MYGYDEKQRVCMSGVIRAPMLAGSAPSKCRFSTWPGYDIGLYMVF